MAFGHHLPSPPPSSRSAELECSQEHGTPSPHSSLSIATSSLQKKQAASISYYSQTLCQAGAADRSGAPFFLSDPFVWWKLYPTCDTDPYSPLSWFTCRTEVSYSERCYHPTHPSAYRAGLSLCERRATVPSSSKAGSKLYQGKRQFVRTANPSAVLKGTDAS